MPTRVVWHGDQARRQIQADLDRALVAATLQIEAQAKVEITNNGQIDTGFMRSSSYTIPPEKGEAIVGFSAEYAIYQELRNSFLYRAAERVRGDDAENAILRVVRGL